MYRTIFVSFAKANRLIRPVQDVSRQRWGKWDYWSNYVTHALLEVKKLVENWRKSSFFAT